MTKNEINDLLHEIKAIGSNFQDAFDRLAAMVHSIVDQNEDKQDQINNLLRNVEEKATTISTLRQDNTAAYSRAVQAENRGWDLEQQLKRASDEYTAMDTANFYLRQTVSKLEEELAELRPFRQLLGDRDRALEVSQIALAEHNETIRKLHEVILTVASSVDSVVNPKPEPKPVQATSPSPEPSTAHHSETGYGNYSQPQHVANF